MIQIGLMLMMMAQGGEIRVPLPENMKKTSDIFFTDQAVYTLDITTNTVTKLDYNGNALKDITANPAQQENPRKLIGIGMYDNKVFMHDFAYRVLLVSDLDLNPIAQLKAPGLPLDALPTKDKVFLVQHDKKSNTMISAYDLQGGKRGGFGEPLKLTKNPFGIQRGLLKRLGDTLYFVHSYRARVDLFKMDGTPINSLSPPGHLNRPLLTDAMLNKPDWRKQIPQIVTKLFLAENGDIYLGLKHRLEEREDLFHYSAEKNVWREEIGFGSFHVDHRNRIFKVVTGGDGRLSLLYSPKPTDK